MKPYTLLPLAAPSVLADCTCGYTVNQTSSPHHALFTNMLETDFLHTYDLTPASAAGMGWIPQTYNQSNAATGPYGMAKMAANVVANPIQGIWDWGGEGVLGGDPGVQLWVRAKKIGGSEGEEGGGVVYVPTAEVVSEREDVLYGSFRIAMKTTGVNGTCSAFFFYRNDTQEIDVEVLSVQQHAASTHHPINLVVQNTTQPLALNGSAPQSSNREFSTIHNPGGDVGDQYHEYRFDWLPDRIDFYLDSYLIWTVTDNVPSAPGAIHFSHWSNGNAGWTQGPPSEDAVMTVAYVKAYFNSTSAPPLSTHDCSSLQWKSDSNARSRTSTRRYGRAGRRGI